MIRTLNLTIEPVCHRLHNATVMTELYFSVVTS